MNSTNVFAVPAGPDLLTMMLQVAPLWSTDHWTASATLRTAHYRADETGVTQLDPNGNPLRVGGVAVEEHADAYTELAGNGEADSNLGALQTTVQSAIGAYLSTQSPSYDTPQAQAFAAAVTVIQVALFAYCATAGK
jgi:hypothetical protein